MNLIAILGLVGLVLSGAFITYFYLLYKKKKDTPNNIITSEVIVSHLYKYIDEAVKGLNKAKDPFDSDYWKIANDEVDTKNSLNGYSVWNNKLNAFFVISTTKPEVQFFDQWDGVKCVYQNEPLSVEDFIYKLDVETHTYLINHLKKSIEQIGNDEVNLNTEITARGLRELILSTKL
jgi:hypothetical protein